MTVLICVLNQPLGFLTILVQYQGWVMITAFGAGAPSIKRAEGLLISSSTNADGLPAAAGNTVVADHPIWTDKLEEYRLTIGPAHRFALVEFGFVVVDVEVNVSFANRVRADVFGKHFPASECFGKSTLWHENSLTVTFTKRSYDLASPDTCDILLSGCEATRPRRSKKNEYQSHGQTSFSHTPPPCLPGPLRGPQMRPYCSTKKSF